MKCCIRPSLLLLRHNMHPCNSECTRIFSSEKDRYTLFNSCKKEATNHNSIHTKKKKKNARKKNRCKSGCAYYNYIIRFWMLNIQWKSEFKKINSKHFLKKSTIWILCSSLKKKSQNCTEETYFNAVLLCFRCSLTITTLKIKFKEEEEEKLEKTSEIMMFRSMKRLIFWRCYFSIIEIISFFLYIFWIIFMYFLF